MPFTLKDAFKTSKPVSSAKIFKKYFFRAKNWGAALIAAPFLGRYVIDIVR
jgi:hypothetical protein